MTVRPELPTVAVVIPYYKTIDLIARAVRSAAANACVTEIIVADDGSDDGVAAVVTPIDARVVCLSAPNAGAPNARNRGLRHASADWVLFLDADDYLDSGYVDVLASQADDADFIIGRHRRIAGDGSSQGEVGYPLGCNGLDLFALYLDTSVQTATTLWRKSYILEIKGWDETVLIGQDIELMFRAFLADGRAGVADTKGLVVYYVDHDQGPRISRDHTRSKLQFALGTFNKYRSPLLALGHPKITEALGARFYGLARVAYIAGYDEIGQSALQEYRSLGFKKHLGTIGHRFTCKIIGLKRKVRLSNALRDFHERHS